MKTYISLLRGINVSGQNKMSMAELRKLYESLKLVNVVTYIQSGNIIFDSKDQDPVTLAGAIEAEIARSLGSSVRVFLRDRSQFKRILDNNPYLQRKNVDPEKLHLTFLSDLPTDPVLSKPATPSGSPDEFMVYDKEIYVYCPNGYGRTKISNTFFERKLGVAATTRNWKTVNALYEMMNQRRP